MTRGSAPVMLAEIEIKLSANLQEAQSVITTAMFPRRFQTAGLMAALAILLISTTRSQAQVVKD